MTLLEVCIMEITFKCDAKHLFPSSFPDLTKDYEEKSLLDRIGSSNCMSENVGSLCGIYLASTFCKEACYQNECLNF